MRALLLALMLAPAAMGQKNAEIDRKVEVFEHELWQIYTKYNQAEKPWVRYYVGPQEAACVYGVVGSDWRPINCSMERTPEPVLDQHWEPLHPLVEIEHEYDGIWYLGKDAPWHFHIIPQSQDVTVPNSYVAIQADGSYWTCHVYDNLEANITVCEKGKP